MATNYSDQLGFTEHGDRWSQETGLNWDPSTMEGRGSWYDWADAADNKGWEGAAEQAGTDVNTLKSTIGQMRTENIYNDTNTPTDFNEALGYNSFSSNDWLKNSDLNWDTSTDAGRANWYNWQNTADEDDWSNWTTQMGQDRGTLNAIIDRMRAGETPEQPQDGQVVSPVPGGGTSTTTNTISPGNVPAAQVVNPITGGVNTAAANTANPNVADFTPDRGNYSVTGVDTSKPGTFAPVTSVEERLTGLLQKENPYMKLARTGAAQQANQRGLLNTSIAAGAGEKAAIESAMPIAQQDAQQANEFERARQAFEYDAAMADAAAANQMESTILQGDYDLSGRALAGNIQSGLLSQTTAADLTKMQSEQQYALETMGTEYGYNQQLAEQDSGIKERLLNIEMDAKMRQTATDDLTKLRQQFSTDYSKIWTDPDLDMNTKADLINSLKTSTADAMNDIATISNVGIEFDMFPDIPGDTAPGGTARDSGAFPAQAAPWAGEEATQEQPLQFNPRIWEATEKAFFDTQDRVAPDAISSWIKDNNLSRNDAAKIAQELNVGTPELIQRGSIDDIIKAIKDASPGGFGYSSYIPIPGRTGGNLSSDPIVASV